MKFSVSVSHIFSNCTLPTEYFEDFSLANDLYKFVGNIVFSYASVGLIPIEIKVLTNDIVVLEVKVNTRGSYIENGVKLPSALVNVSYDDVTDFIPHDSKAYEECYLTCIHEESNNYKYYKLIPMGNELQAEYGRIGAEKGERFGAKTLNNPYDIKSYYLKYYEKLSKGYIDQTEVFLTPRQKEDILEEAPKKANAKTVGMELFERLKQVSRQYVSEILISSKVTKSQYEKAREQLDNLIQATNIDDFNKILKDLMRLSPRKVSKVSEQMAKESSSMAKIISREERLVNSMQAVVEESGSKDNFKDYGISVFKATEKQRLDVVSRLNSDLQDRVCNVYRVIDKGQKQRFDNYLRLNNIKKVKMFWHGSTTENWFSIIVNSLSLNPNAHITGKMFGYGIYFAPSARKSLGYTSLSGSYWAKGRENRGFLGLYAIAYGKPYNVSTSKSSMTKSELTRLGYDSLHAHAGTQLMNDEVIVYDENALLLQYLVEIK